MSGEKGILCISRIALIIERLGDALILFILFITNFIYRTIYPTQLEAQVILRTPQIKITIRKPESCLRCIFTSPIH